jgi:Spy/CpxP family protein refolding chaperone
MLAYCGNEIRDENRSIIGYTITPYNRREVVLMRRALLTLLMITVLATGYTLSARAQNTNGQQKTVKTYYRLTGRYTRMLNTMITAALGMDITDDQKKSVSDLNDKYVIPISATETEIRQSDIEIEKMLQDPSFDPAKVKKEMDKVNADRKKVMNDYVDCLASLRDTIGKENYKTLKESQYRYRRDLVQMRKHGLHRSPPSDKMNNGNGQTTQPGSKTQNSGN